MLIRYKSYDLTEVREPVTLEVFESLRELDRVSMMNRLIEENSLQRKDWFRKHAFGLAVTLFSTVAFLGMVVIICLENEGIKVDLPGLPDVPGLDTIGLLVIFACLVISISFVASAISFLGALESQKNIWLSFHERLVRYPSYASYSADFQHPVPVPPEEPDIPPIPRKKDSMEEWLG